MIWPRRAPSGYLHAPLAVGRSGDDAQVGTERIGQRRHEWELGAHLARREQAPDAGRVAVDAPGKFGFGYAKVNPERVEIPDHYVGPGEFACGPLIRQAVLRVLHPAGPATLVQAHVEHLRVGHDLSWRSVA